MSETETVSKSGSPEVKKQLNFFQESEKKEKKIKGKEKIEQEIEMSQKELKVSISKKECKARKSSKFRPSLMLKRSQTNPDEERNRR